MSSCQLPDQNCLKMNYYNLKFKRDQVKNGRFLLLCEELRNYVFARERATKVTKNLNDKTGSSGQTYSMDRSVTHRKPVPENMPVSQYKSSAQTLVTTGSNLHLNKRNSMLSVNKCRNSQQNHWSDECN